ncbi:MAG TPA: HAD-IIB family hydrolase [Pyrinomonadaceae bacterium]
MNPPTNTIAPNIRLLVLDLDGTIVNHPEHIRESVVRAAQLIQRRGVAVAIATGRLFQTALPAYRLIGSTLPLICYEGALIKEPLTGLVHRHLSLDPEVIIKLSACAGRLSVHFHIQDKVFISTVDRFTEKFYEGFNVELSLTDDLRGLEGVTKVTMLSDDPAILAELSNRFADMQIRIRTSQYKSLSVLEGLHPLVSKRLAVKYLAEEIMNLRPEEVMTIGDDFTDSDLFEYAGLSVAMGNASDEVKASADWVTSNIEEDGMAHAVNRWLSLCPA